MKNVVICCDGTANECKEERTNVVKLFSTLIQDPVHQVAYYHPGLGTMEAVGAIISAARKITRLLGKAIGYGLESDIRDAYVFLMNNFDPGDRLFLVGFSRGAYTVRTFRFPAAYVWSDPQRQRRFGAICDQNVERGPPEPIGISSLRSDGAISSLKPNVVTELGHKGSVFALADDFKATFSRADLQALVCRRLGHRKFGRLDREIL